MNFRSVLLSIFMIYFLGIVSLFSEQGRENKKVPEINKVPVPEIQEIKIPCILQKEKKEELIVKKEISKNQKALNTRERTSKPQKNKRHSVYFQTTKIEMSSESFRYQFKLKISRIPDFTTYLDFYADDYNVTIEEITKIKQFEKYWLYRLVLSGTRKGVLSLMQKMNEEFSYFEE